MLWQTLHSIAVTMDDPWCILGDFNAILHKEERIGGEEVQYGDSKDFQCCLEDCEL